MESLTEVLGLGGLELTAVRREGVFSILEARSAARVERCPRCGSGHLHSHGWRLRRLSHVPLAQSPCILELRFRRFRCQDCRAVSSPDLEAAAPRRRLSAALRRWVAFAALELRVALAALGRWLKLGWGALRACIDVPPPPNLEDLRHLCLDEVFFREPRRYLTVLSCADGRVLGLAEGRGATPSMQLLQRLPPAVLEQVQTLATDFNWGQRRAALEQLPNALVCADHFHLARLIRRMVRETPAAQRLQSRRAARELRAVLRGGDSSRLEDWIADHAAATGALGALQRHVQRWQLEIESAIETGRSTGPAEALNRKIALLRRQACGYTNRDSFIQRILWLNLSPHHKG
jgi:transposase